MQPGGGVRGAQEGEGQCTGLDGVRSNESVLKQSQFQLFQVCSGSRWGTQRHLFGCSQGQRSHETMAGALGAGVGQGWRHGLQGEMSLVPGKADPFTDVQHGGTNGRHRFGGAGGRAEELRGRDGSRQKAWSLPSRLGGGEWLGQLVLPGLCASESRAQPAVINHLGYLTRGACAQFLFALIHLSLATLPSLGLGACSDLSI